MPAVRHLCPVDETASPTLPGPRWKLEEPCCGAEDWEGQTEQSHHLVSLSLSFLLCKMGTNHLLNAHTHLPSCEAEGAQGHQAPGLVPDARWPSECGSGIEEGRQLQVQPCSDPPFQPSKSLLTGGDPPGQAEAWVALALPHWFLSLELTSYSPPPSTASGRNARQGGCRPSGLSTGLWEPKPSFRCSPPSLPAPSKELWEPPLPPGWPRGVA